MKVVWLVNLLLPDICEKLNFTKSYGGGWVNTLLKDLNKSDDSINFYVIAPSNLSKVEAHLINNITYILVPCNNNTKYQKKLELYFKDINDSIQPDVVHIHGTEHPFPLAYIKACPSLTYAVSIQGLLTNYAKYYFGGISFFDILLYTTLRDYVRWDTLFHQKRDMIRRGKNELEILKCVNHIFGRTHYDKAITWAINLKSKYHVLNEPLRDSFYNQSWNYENCSPYSIFISQSYYPIKGLHQFLKALDIIVKIYPQTIVYIAGFNFFEKSFIRTNGFGHYIRSFIKKMGLKKHIRFLGILDEVSMVKEFLKSNVVVNPSIIENSSNSICEAQILGVPCIASNVGGSSDLIQNGFNGFLYRYEEYEILAKYISEIFSDIDLAKNISFNSRATALERHDRLKIVEQCKKIYSEIYDNKL
jgi:glycosyltransferase involved in cell wall biosynthesis